MVTDFDYLVIMAEHPQDDQRRSQSTALRHPEHACLAVHKKEAHKVQIGRLGQQDRSGVTYQRSRPLQIGRYRNADDSRNWGDF